MPFDDPFANLDPADAKPSAKPSAKPRPTPKGKFDKPLVVSRQEAYKATGSGGSVMHGRHYQLTSRLPMEIVDQLRDWAEKLGMSQQDLQRYCFYRGLQALEDGERPEFEEVVVRKRLKPRE